MARRLHGDLATFISVSWGPTMIKTRKSADARLFFAKCDCTGLKGHWECENTGPAAGDRDDAKRIALQSGWARISNHWYCPDCQRDHLAPKPSGAVGL